MSNKYNLYPFCDKWFEKGGSIWITSDPHFNDPDVEKFRHHNITSDEWIKKQNRKCGKNDTLIILGDIGDISCVSKLRAGYKVLITGNHDSGVSNYQKECVLKKIDGDSEDFKNLTDDQRNHLFCPVPPCGVSKEMYFSDISHQTGVPTQKIYEFLRKEKPEYGIQCDGVRIDWILIESNKKPFDEVYDGVLTISSNMKLSHEQDPDKYHLNIHGHQHGEECKVIQEMFKMYDRDINTEDYIKAQLNTIKTKGLMEMNCCTEWLGYEPVNLGDIIKSGILKNIPDIHREAIDKQTEKSLKKKKS